MLSSNLYKLLVLAIIMERQKRGFSHVDVILAFAIFAGAMLFLLFFVNRQGDSSDIQSSLEANLAKVAGNVSSELESDSVKVLIQPASGVMAVSISGDSDRGVRVENLSGDKVPAVYENNVAYFKPGNGGSFFIIHLSKDIDRENSFSERPSVDTSLYQLGATSLSELMSEKQIINLQANYQNSYNTLKEELNIPLNKDFSIAVSLSNKKIEMLKEPNSVNTNIFSLTKRIEVLRSNGRIEFADFRMTLW